MTWCGAKWKQNFIAPVHLASLFAEHLATKRRGNYKYLLRAGICAYCVYACLLRHKAAIHSLTLSLRHQLKDTGVKVFEIAPPSVDTELGYQRRTDKTQTHGGIPVSEFLKEAMEAIKNDTLEAKIGGAKHIHGNPEEAFKRMNG